MKIFVSLCIFVSFFTSAKAQSVTIPDANFVAWLQANVPSAMNGNQMNISSPAVTNEDTINVYSLGISDLTGIQYFNSLVYLNCSYNSISTLPPLSNSLQTLDCSANSQLTTLPFLPASLKRLLSFACQSLNTLPSLPNSLTELSCFYCHLISLPALPNSLQYLACYGNYITCFPTFPNSLISLVITTSSIHPHESFDCLPNYIPSMDSLTHTFPICGPGNSNGCPLGITEIVPFSDNAGLIIVYPNPTTTILNIETQNKGFEVHIANLIEKEIRIPISVSAMSSRGETFSLDVSSLPNGIYFVSVKTNEGLFTKKVVVQH